MAQRGTSRIRLVALDVDGTILDESGTLSESARDAVAAVRERGIQVVLCTGRRFRTAAPIAHELGISGPIVVHNGAIVRDVASGETLETRLLPTSLYTRAYSLLREVGGPLVYLEGHPEEIDFCFEPAAHAHPFQREYLDLYGHNGREVRTLAEPPHEHIIMLSLMADEASLRALRPRAEAALGSEVRTHLLVNKNFQGCILEIAARRAGKWRATEALARGLGIEAHEILAIGDDQNDAELLSEAGIGIAMGNASAEVMAVADEVTTTNDDHGVARALERHILDC